MPPVDRPSLPSLPSLPSARLLEVAHVSRRLSVGDEFVRHQLRTGKLKGVRIGNRWRVDPRDLEAFIDGGRTS